MDTEGKGNPRFGDLASGKWVPASMGKGWEQGEEGKEQMREREKGQDAHLPPVMPTSGPQPAESPHLVTLGSGIGPISWFQPVVRQ